MCAFPFASCVPFADNTQPSGGLLRRGVLLRAAAHAAPEAAVLEAIEAAMQLHGPHVLRYADKKRGQRRAARLVHDDISSTLQGFLLAGDTSAQGWISTLLRDALPAHPYGRALLVPGATPPVPVVSRGKPVCTCVGVTDVAIESHLKACAGSPAERLASLQSTLGCGTQCGSCVPQLQRMVQAA
jgi:assimilatory nitrate reductase catalytic subunit